MHKQRQRHIHKEDDEKTKKTSICKLKREPEKSSPSIPQCRTSSLWTTKKYTYFEATQSVVLYYEKLKQTLDKLEVFSFIFYIFILSPICTQPLNILKIHTSNIK